VKPITTVARGSHAQWLARAQLSGCWAVPGVGSRGNAEYWEALSWVNARGSPIKGHGPSRPSIAISPVLPPHPPLAPNRPKNNSLYSGWWWGGWSAACHHHHSSVGQAWLLTNQPHSSRHVEYCSHSAVLTKTFLLSLVCSLPPAPTVFSTFPAYLNRFEC